jgi:hypothetical protein
MGNGGQRIAAQEAGNAGAQLLNGAVESGGPGQNRTGDTRIFSAVLYQLSYRATGSAI